MRDFYTNPLAVRFVLKIVQSEGAANPKGSPEFFFVGCTPTISLRETEKHPPPILANRTEEQRSYARFLHEPP